MYKNRPPVLTKVIIVAILQWICNRNVIIVTMRKGIGGFIMYKSKTIKKSIVVAAAAGMIITTSLGTVSASQLLNDSTVGISSAFDKYANTLAGNKDKNADGVEEKTGENATSSDAPKGTGIDPSTAANETAGKNASDSTKKEKKQKTEKVIKYPQFENKCIAVTDDYVNIRSEAGTDSDVVGIIGNAGVADVLEKGKEWTKVTSGSCTGYIRNDLLLYGDDAGEYAEANCSKQATVNTETLNVREQADADADCITQVGQGQSFDIISQDDKWIQIALDDSTSGYVSAEFIEYTYNMDEAKSIEEIQAEIQAEEDSKDETADDSDDAMADDSQETTDDDETDADQDSSDNQSGYDDENADDSSDQSDNGDTDDQGTDDTQDSSDDSGTDDSDDSDGDSSDGDNSDGDDSDEDNSDDDSDSTVAPSGQTGIDLANYATQFVGNPYVYGGSSLTDGADCSGFVMAVYAQFGYSLPHSAGAQSGYGTRVDTSSLEPGDIVFYGYGGSIEHCAIYIGNGMIVHASTEETGIKISSAYYSDPICAVRLIGQ